MAHWMRKALLGLSKRQIPLQLQGRSTAISSIYILYLEDQDYHCLALPNSKPVAPIPGYLLVSSKTASLCQLATAAAPVYEGKK